MRTLNLITRFIVSSTYFNCFVRMWTMVSHVDMAPSVGHWIEYFPAFASFNGHNFSSCWASSFYPFFAFIAYFNFFVMMWAIRSHVNTTLFVVRSSVKPFPSITFFDGQYLCSCRAPSFTAPFTNANAPIYDLHIYVIYPFLLIGAVKHTEKLVLNSILSRICGASINWVLPSWLTKIISELVFFSSWFTYYFSWTTFIKKRYQQQHPP